MPLLHWLTREKDIQEARKAPYRLLGVDGRGWGGGKVNPGGCRFFVRILTPRIFRLFRDEVVRYVVCYYGNTLS